jgi:hypothetical protein
VLDQFIDEHISVLVVDIVVGSTMDVEQVTLKVFGMG